ncbi:MAG: ABC transporter ATP-binding protein [Lachnospiraceae bacterium]|jgi:putative ABC transport system ATP-binding protein|nr:ABC transporter ATP-binding protein [Lachnospiraceae bacterium]
MGMVELRNVSRIYENGGHAVYALREVSFTVEPGEFTVILGPSGAGKSTLLNILGGIDRADKGSVKVAGEEVTVLTEKEMSLYRARRVGFVFQFYNLIPTLTVQENVGLMRELKKEALPAEDVLNKLGLRGQGRKFPGQLSGGEQQRVSIARAIAKNPDILLCDEPTGALDSETGCMVLEELQKLCREEGKTILIVTHNASIAKAADKVIRIKNGAVRDVEVNPRPLKISEVDW